MKKLMIIIGLGCLLAGCAVPPRAPFEPTMAGVFTQISAPLTTDVRSTPVKNLKSGEASVENILGVVATGDCSLRAAAENGGIETIEFVDYSSFNILWVYQKTTVTVYGR